MKWLKAQGRWTALNLLALSVMISLPAMDGPAGTRFGNASTSLASGKWAVRFLLVSLTMTPLQRFFGWNHAIKLRKPAGLWSFVFASLHSLLTLQEASRNLLRPPLPLYILLGLGAFLILGLLALTSNQWAMRRLKKNWKRLHRFVYLAAGAVTCHGLLAASMSKKMFLQDPEAIHELRIYLAMAIVLLAVRIPQVSRLLRKIRLPRQELETIGRTEVGQIEVRPIPPQPSSNVVLHPSPMPDNAAARPVAGQGRVPSGIMDGG